MTTFDPGSLSQNTTYYWRIDEINGYGTTPGGVWSFTTTGSTSQPIGIDSSIGTGSSDVESNYLEYFHIIGSNSNRVLVVGVSSEDNDATSDMTITGVTYDGVAMLPVTGSSAIVGSGFKMRTDLYYMLDSALPTGGSHKVTVSTNGLVNNLSAGAISLYNVAQQPAASVHTNVNTDTNTISTDTEVTTNGSWVVDVVGCGNEGGFTAIQPQQVKRWEKPSIGSSSSAASTRHIELTGVFNTMSWQHSGANRMAHSLAVFEPASN